MRGSSMQQAAQFRAVESWNGLLRMDDDDTAHMQSVSQSVTDRGRVYQGLGGAKPPPP